MTPQAEQRIRDAAARFADELIEALSAAQPASSGGEPRLLSVPQAAELLGGIARSTVYELMATGRLKSVRVLGRRLIPASALRELVQPEPEPPMA